MPTYNTLFSKDLRRMIFVVFATKLNEMMSDYQTAIPEIDQGWQFKQLILFQGFRTETVYSLQHFCLALGPSKVEEHQRLIETRPV